MSVGNGRLRFGNYELDSASGKLFRGGLPVKIQPQPLRVLGVLLERPGELVSREQLRLRVWGNATFVEFDQGLNYSIRQIRLALRDGASQPVYIETLPKQGYRFIAGVVAVPNGEEPNAAPEPIVTKEVVDPPIQNPSYLAPVLPLRLAPRPPAWFMAAAAFCAVTVIAAIAVYSSFRRHPIEVKYTQITDFTDSAMAPALSPDGRMMAFIRGSSDFLTADQIYVMMLPNGEAKRLTDDGRPKYNLAFSPDGSQIAYTVLDARTWATYTCRCWAATRICY